MRYVIALSQRMVDQAALTLMVQLQLQFANKLRDRSLIMFQDKSAQIFPNKFATMSQDTTFKENLQEEMSLR